MVAEWYQKMSLQQWLCATIWVQDKFKEYLVITININNQNTQQIGMVNMEPKLRPGRPLNIYQQVNDVVISTAI